MRDDLSERPLRFVFKCLVAWLTVLSTPLSRRKKRTHNAKDEGPPPLRKLSKSLWQSHESTRWGEDVFTSLELNAMSGRPAGEYYVTVDGGRIAFDDPGLDAGEAWIAIAGDGHTDPDAREWHDTRHTSSCYSEAVHEAKKVTRRGYR